MPVEDKIAELQDRGFCVLKAQFAKSLVEACREGLWPILLEYIEGHRDQPNRGPHRHLWRCHLSRPVLRLSAAMVC